MTEPETAGSTELRTEIIYVRATGPEKSLVYARAGEAGLSASRYLVRLATGRPLPDRAQRQRLERLLFLVKRSALTLQELAGRLRGSRHYSDSERRDLLETAEMLTDLLSALRRGL